MEKRLKKRSKISINWLIKEEEKVFKQLLI